MRKFQCLLFVLKQSCLYYQNEEIHNRDTKCYIENTCHQSSDLFNQIPGEFQVQKQPLVVFFKFLKGS